MCNFTNRLFVFLTFAAYGLTSLNAVPAYTKHGHVQQTRNVNELNDLLALLGQDTDYDLHYDQRQKGDENLRIKMDGFFIGVTPEEQSSLVVVTEDLNDYWETLLGSGKQQNMAADRKYQAALPDHPANGEQAQAIVVQIPAPKKDIEARQRSEQIVADDAIQSRTKFHMYNLLKLLKSRKN